MANRQAETWVVFIRFKERPKIYGPYRRTTAMRIAQVMKAEFPGLEIKALILRRDPTSEL